MLWYRSKLLNFALYGPIATLTCLFLYYGLRAKYGPLEVIPSWVVGAFVLGGLSWFMLFYLGTMGVLIS